MSENILELVEGLTLKDNKAACMAAETLAGISNRDSSVYGFINQFVKLMSHKNSYVRNRAFLLLSANAKWDSDNVINSIIDEYLSHITDEKPITSRQCIKGLREIAAYKPELSSKIRLALENADLSQYKDSMAPLIRKDIAEVLGKIRD